jgi:hypothetical protein
MKLGKPIVEGVNVAFLTRRNPSATYFEIHNFKVN